MSGSKELDDDIHITRIAEVPQLVDEGGLVMDGVAAAILGPFRGAIAVDRFGGASGDHDEHIVVLVLVNGSHFAAGEVELPDSNVVVLEQDRRSDGLNVVAHCTSLQAAPR